MEKRKVVPPPPRLSVRWCSLLVTLALGLPVVAQERFVSPNGNDGNDGSVGSPWLTIDRVNSYLQGTGANGSTIHFERGGTYTGSVQVLGRNDVTFQAYGSGEPPRISGAEEVGDQSWTQHAGNVYRTTLSLNQGDRVKQVYQAGVRMTLAREPNTGWNRTTAVTAFPAPDQLQDNALGAQTNQWVGAEVILRYANWGYVRGAVTENTATTLTVVPGAFWRSLGAGWGYFIQDHQAALDAPGEWYYDGTDLFVVGDGNGAPSGITYVVEYDQDELNQGFNINEFSRRITIRDLAISHHAKAGVSVNSSGAIEVEGCSFTEVFTGIADFASLNDTESTTSVYRDNTFNNILDRAFNLGSENLEVEGNTISDNGLWPGQGGFGFAHEALVCRGANNTVRANHIHDVGYTGIAVEGDNSVVEHNRVERAGRILNDAAGITLDNCDNVVIRENIVTDLSSGLEERLGSVSSDIDEYIDITFGIYFGNRPVRNSTVEDNVVTACGAGVHVDHNGDVDNVFGAGTEGNVVRNNTLFNNTVQLSLTDYSNCNSAEFPLDNCIGVDQGVGGENLVSAYDTEYSGNILYCLSGGQRLAQHQHTYSSNAGELVNFGVFSNNAYHNPFTDVAVYERVFYAVTNVTGFLGESVIPHTLAGWQNPPAAAPRDLGSTRSPLRLKDFDAYGLTAIPNDLLSADMSGGDVTAWGSTTSGVVCNDCQQGGYLLQAEDQEWIEKGQSSYMYIRPDVTQSGEEIDEGQYHFTFRMRSPDTDAIRFGPVYQDPSYRQYQYLGLSPEWRTYEMTFNVPDLGGNDYMVSAFQNVQYSLGMLDGSVVELDFIEAKACTLNTGHSATIAQEHILRYNCPLSDEGGQNAGYSFTIPGDPGQCWSDVHGNFYAAGDTYELDEWASVVLFRMDATFDIDVATYDVLGNETWTTDRNVRGSVVIADGGTLTIDGATIRFAESTPALPTNIIVEPGGMLVLKNNAHLTTVVECGAMQMWDGIKVLGIAAGRDWSTEQGRVEMLSGARISNALTGILAGDADPASPGFTGTTRGGAIRTQDAFFENNLYDVVMHQGGALPPLFGCNGGPCEASAFRNTQFLTTAPLNRPELDPKTHLRLSNRRTIWVYGCTFSNELPEHTESLRMGHGVECFNTAARIVECLNPACSVPAPNTFSNLDHGVRLLESFPKAPVAIVRGNTFSDNICGVYASGVNGISITENEFALGRWFGVALEGDEDVAFNFHHRGVFTTRSWALTIQDNTFDRSGGTPSGALLEGIVAGYTEDHNDVVYRNTASNLTMGFVGEGISADVSGGNPNTIGLQFQCNTNVQNETNLMSRKANGDEDNEVFHTIRGLQGNEGLAAGNSFDQNTVWDFAKNTEAAPIITYFYDAVFSDQEPVNHPADVDPVVITGTQNACIEGPGGLVPGGGPVSVEVLKPVLSTSKYEYGTLRYQYEQLIDGGNTDEVVQEIISAWPQDIWDLRNALLSRSPYLSVETLKQLVNKQTIPVAIKLEICLANPEATQKDGFLKWAEYEALSPLPAYALATIEASWNTKTYRFALEAQLAAKHTRMTQAVNTLLELYTVDSLRSTPDSLRWVWQQLRTNAARYAETGLLVGQERFTEALAVLDAMPQEKEMRAKEQTERQRMLDYVGLLANAHADGRDAFALNTQEVQQLEMLVGDHYDRPAVWASNLLCVQYKKCRAPYTGGSPTPKSTSLLPQVLSGATPAAALQIHPNPANSWTAFTYQLPGNTTTLQLRIRDAQGRIAHTLQASGEEGQVVWDTRSIAPGVYTVELLREGQVERTERLVIQQ